MPPPRDQKCRHYRYYAELQEVFYQRALDGDVSCGALVTKIIERRCVLLGLHTPQSATLQIVEAQAPRQTGTDRIEAALNAFLANQHGGDKPH